MNNDHDLQRRISGVFADEAPSGYPEELLGRVLTTTSRTRPRPTWLANIKEPPMRIPARVVVGSPTLRLATILALTIALALALAGAVAGAASLLPSEPLPEPFGPARNGSMVYSKGGDIYLADADGANARPIITGDTNDWSPWFSHDGQTIAFARGDEPDYQGMLADADGSNVRPLLDKAGEWNIEFTPDDTRMVGTRTVGNGTALSVIDLATSATRDLALGDVEAWYWQEPRPNSDEIIFMGHTTPGGPERGLYAIQTDGSGLRTIGDVSTGDTHDGAVPFQRSFQDIDLSPDGKLVAFWSWEPRDGVPGAQPDAYLHLRDLDTGEELPVLFDYLGVQNPKGDDNGLLPRFSPDGTMMVHDGCLPNPLCYGPIDGSVPTKSIGPFFDYTQRQGFEFSPDGTKVILFLTFKSVLIDLATNTWTDLPIAGDWVSWQRLAP